MASLRVQRNPLYNRWQIRLTRLRKLPCAEVTKGYILKHSLHTGALWRVLPSLDAPPKYYCLPKGRSTAIKRHSGRHSDGTLNEKSAPTANQRLSCK